MYVIFEPTTQAHARKYTENIETFPFILCLKLIYFLLIAKARFML